MSQPSIESARFSIDVSEDVILDLRARLAATRWPDDVGNEDGYYGIREAYLKELADYWRTEFDWRQHESRLNRYAQYRLKVSGVPVHFVHVAGVGPSPTPLVLSHGWPWTYLMYEKVIGPLTDPAAYGRDPAEAFDVVLPSLPGFGFSGPVPERPDMNFWKIADLWDELMTRHLGYGTYVAAGADLGSLITGTLGHKYADHIYAVQLGSPLLLEKFSDDRSWDVTNARTVDRAASDRERLGFLAGIKKFGPHLAVHMLDPSTQTFGLHDSPVGMLSWLLERWQAWSDCGGTWDLPFGGNVERVFSKDELLINATIYWVTGTIGSSMRSYANSYRYPWKPSHDRRPVVEAPAGVIFVGHENPPGLDGPARVKAFLESEAASWFNLVNVVAHDRGGHFIPWELPEEWVDDLLTTCAGRVPGHAPRRSAARAMS